MIGISIADDARRVQICFACEQPFILGSTLFQTCDACRIFMEAGVICISVSDDAPEGLLHYKTAQPYRSGNWCVVTEERIAAVRAYLPRSGKRRHAFIRDSLWRKIGLPRAGKSGASQMRKGKYEPQAED